MATQDPQDSGVQFGQYQLVSRLGEGGMAQVFLAIKEGPLGFRKELAIKRIREDVIREDEALHKALINEARLGGQLKHPNVVDTYEFGVVEDQHYIAMEYVDGLTLRDLIRGARGRGVQLPPSAVLDMGCQLCDGLQYAHTLASSDGDPLNLIHRDLKPSNVIVSMAGQAKIMDFGIARFATAMYQTTASDAPKGTLAYMSPEQMQDPRSIDHRSDLFAVGAILFEALTGHVLMDTGDARTLVFLLITGKYLPRLEILRQLHPAVAAPIERCLALDREDRYADAEELGRDLRRLRDSHGSELGCRDLMALVRACREGGGRLETVRQQVLEQQSTDDPGTGWPVFIDSLSDAPVDGPDPLSESSLRPLGAGSLVARHHSSTTLSHPGGVSGSTTPATVAAEPGTRTLPAGTMPPRVETTGSGPSAAGAWRRGVGFGLALLVVFVAGLGTAVWRPWDRGTAPDPGGPGDAAEADEATDGARGAVPVEPETAPPVGPAAGDPSGEERSSPGAEDAFPPDGTEQSTVAAPRDAPTSEATSREEKPLSRTDEPAEEADPTPNAPPAGVAPAEVSVTVNTDPWSTWVLGGDAQGAGSHTPYFGKLPPGNYEFTLVEPISGATHRMSITIVGDEESVVRCWSFTKGGPC